MMEFYDKGGNHFGSGDVSLDALHQDQSGDVEIGAVLLERLAEIVVHP